MLQSINRTLALTSRVIHRNMMQRKKRFPRVSSTFHTFKDIDYIRDSQDQTRNPHAEGSRRPVSRVPAEAERETRQNCQR